MGTRVYKWISDDGQEFDCEVDMLEHDAWIARKDRVEAWLDSMELTPASRTRRMRTVMRYLAWAADPEEISTIPLQLDDEEARR